MIRQLEELVDAFKGPESQTRCFTHILNLIAKSVIRQFDVPKARARDNEVFDEATMALIELAGNIDVEEQEMAESRDDGDDDEDDENVEGWMDEMDTMTAEQLTALNESVQPVRLMLVKVRRYLSSASSNMAYHTCHSFVKLHLRSRTHPLLFFPDGMRSLKN